MTALRFAIAWTLVIVVLCLIPGSDLPDIDAPLSTDKWVHAAMFFGFGALWTMAQPRKWWAVFGVGVVLGAAIEVVQYMLQWGRSGDVWDFAADVVGLVAGMGLAWAISARTATA